MMVIQQVEEWLCCLILDMEIGFGECLMECWFEGQIGVL